MGILHLGGRYGHMEIRSNFTYAGRKKYAIMHNLESLNKVRAKVQLGTFKLTTMEGKKTS